MQHDETQRKVYNSSKEKNDRKKIIIKDMPSQDFPELMKQIFLFKFTSRNISVTTRVKEKNLKINQKENTGQQATRKNKLTTDFLSSTREYLQSSERK